MNYRHAFHAGNHADVLKHVVLLALCDALAAKPAPCFALDTHAGRGLYRLDGEAARQTGEALDGIGRLRGAAAALLGTVTSSFVIILAIAIFFAGIRQNPVVDAAFKGMRPAVVALLIGPVLTLSRGMHWTMLVVIAASALAIWWLDWSPIWILAAAAALGIAWELSMAKQVKGKR